MMEQSGATWMDAAQQEQFREICGMIDTIKSGRDFYRVMERINGGGYGVDVINAAREYKQRLFLFPRFGYPVIIPRAVFVDGEVPPAVRQRYFHNKSVRKGIALGFTHKRGKLIVQPLLCEAFVVKETIYRKPVKLGRNFV